MNIYALKGHKVIVTEKSANNGYSYDSEKVKRLLQVGVEYTVYMTQVDDSQTDVWLLEFPNEKFNAVNFADINEQDLELDKEHPDWKRYNKI